MALNFEQFKQLRDKGLSNDQIAKFESGYKPIQPEQPSLAKSLVESPLGVASGVGKGALSTLSQIPKSISNVIGAATTKKIGTGSEESIANLSQVTERAMDKVNSMPEGQQKTQLMGIVNENLKKIQDLSGGMRQTRSEFAAKTELPAITKAIEPKTTAEKVGFMAEQIGEFLIPGKGAETGVKLLTGILPKAGAKAQFAAKTVGEATEFAIKTAAQTGGDIPQTTGTFLISLAIPPVIKGFGDVAKGIGTKLPERLYSRIFKTAEDDLRAAYQTTARGKQINPTLAREVLDRGLKGNSENMAVYAFNKLDDLERQVQTVVKSTKNPPLVVGNKATYIRFLQETKDMFKGGFFTDKAREASTLLKELGQTDSRRINMATALKLRRFIDNMRSTSSFKLNPNLASRQEEFKYAANLLRQKLAKAGLSDLMNEERVFIEAIDAIVSDAAKSNNKNIIGLVDILAGGGGIASGSIVGGVGAAAAIRTFQQPFTLTNLGYAVDRLTKKMTGITEPIIRGVIGGYQQTKVGQ